MVPEEYIKRLIEISEKKYKLLQDMYILTAEQAKTLNEEGLEQLHKIIDAKQRLIEEIDKLDEEFNVYFQRLKQGLGVKNLDEVKGSPASNIKELQASVKNVMDLIKEISELDGQNTDHAKKLLGSIGNEIKKINQSKKINMAYNPGSIMQTPSYFIDKKK